VLLEPVLKNDISPPNKVIDWFTNVLPLKSSFNKGLNENVAGFG
jgi:hypothetical protein